MVLLAYAGLETVRETTTFTQQQQHLLQNKKQVLQRVHTRLLTLYKSPVLQHKTPSSSFPSPAAAAAAAASVPLRDGHSWSRFQNPKFLSSNSSSSSTNNIAAWLRGNSIKESPLSRVPREAGQAQSLAVLSAWQKRRISSSSSSSSGSRLWGDTGASPSVHLVRSAAKQAAHASYRLPLFSPRRTTAATAGQSPVDAFSLGTGRLVRSDDYSPQGDSSKATAAAAVCRCTDTARSGWRSKRQQVATLQQQLQLQPSRSLNFSSQDQRAAAESGYGLALAAARGGGAPAAVAASGRAEGRAEARPTTSSAAATDVWISVPYLHPSWTCVELLHRQQQPQQQLWHSRTSSAAAADVSPQLHRVFSMRRPEKLSGKSSGSSSSLWGAANTRETLGPRETATDVIEQVQAPRASRRPSLLQPGCLQRSAGAASSTTTAAATASPASAAAGGGGYTTSGAWEPQRGSSTSSSQQQNQETVASARAAACAAAAALHRGGTARVRAAKEGAAVVAQRAAAAALIAAAEEVGDGLSDSRQEGKFFYPEQCIRDRLQKLFWGLSV